MHSTEARDAASPWGLLSISSHRLEQGIVVEVIGEVDLGTASIVEDELRRAEESEDLVVLDLMGVSFMDSTGIRMIIAADNRLRGRGARLHISHVPPQVEKLFKLVGIADHLVIDEELDGQPEPFTGTS